LEITEQTEYNGFIDVVFSFYDPSYVGYVSIEAFLFNVLS